MEGGREVEGEAGKIQRNRSIKQRDKKRGGKLLKTETFQWK